MENASKALLIAAGSLIAILLLSLFAYAYQKMNGNASELYAMMEEAKINEFNQQFLNYYGIKDGITVQDVASVIYLSRNANKTEGHNIKVYIENIGEILETASVEELLKNKIDVKYDCTKVSIDSTTKIVNGIWFKEK